MVTVEEEKHFSRRTRNISIPACFNSFIIVSHESFSSEFELAKRRGLQVTERTLKSDEISFVLFGHHCVFPEFELDQSGYCADHGD